MSTVRIATPLPGARALLDAHAQAAALTDLANRAAQVPADPVAAASLAGKVPTVNKAGGFDFTAPANPTGQFAA